MGIQTHDLRFSSPPSAVPQPLPTPSLCGVKNPLSHKLQQALGHVAYDLHALAFLTAWNDEAN